MNKKKTTLFLSLASIIVLNIGLSQDLNFKNQAFINAVLNYDPTIDINKDGKIQEDESNLVKKLDLFNMNINNVEDISFFKNIEEIILTNNSIDTLKLENFEKLRSIKCARNKLVVLTLKNLPALEEIYCGVNLLSSVTIENTPKISTINLMDNALKSIEISEFKKLKYLYIQQNKLEKLDINNNLELVQFDISENLIESIDISKNTKLNLKILYLDENVKVIGTKDQLKNFKKAEVLIQY